MTLLSLIAAALVAAYAQQEDTRQQEEPEIYNFEVEVHAVYTDVFVTRNGKPVTGLSAADFEVFDSGVPQEVEFIDLDELALATILVLDASGSVHGEQLENLKAAAHAFAEQLKDADEVGLLTFSSELRFPAELGSDVEKLHRALEQPMETGWTSLYDAVYAASKLLETRAGRPLMVLFTDGLDNASWLTATETLEELRASQTMVHAVSYQRETTYGSRYSGRSIVHVATYGGSDFLEAMTGATGGRVWYIESSANLTEAFLGILTEMKSRYLLAYQPHGVPLDGWHELTIRVKNGQADEVRARPGYIVQPSRD